MSRFLNIWKADIELIQRSVFNRFILFDVYWLYSNIPTPISSVQTLLILFMQAGTRSQMDSGTGAILWIENQK